MTADISRILRQYGKQYRSLDDGLNSKTKLDRYRYQAIKRIACIIPHHCSDHSNCCYDDCKMIQLQRHFIAKDRVEFPTEDGEDEVPMKDILRLHKQGIRKEYAKAFRFSGKAMSMGKIGQQTVYREITKRLNEGNIDRVSLAMSSNDCENYFGLLSKFSHGKRIYFGQTDSWQVY